MMNFGIIEFLSYHYLNELEPTRERFDQNLGQILSKRIERIVALVAASPVLTNAQKNEIGALWTEVGDLAIWRNRIAHNPVLPTWHAGSDSKTSPPDLIGIPDMKQIRRSDISDSISIEGLKKLVDASADLGQRLFRAAAALRRVA